MKGYLYKELRQNRLFLSLSVLLASAVAFLPVLIVMIDEKTMAKEAFYEFSKSAHVLRPMIMIAGLLVMLILESFTLRGDDKKIWSYFVASAPRGIKSYIFTKYAFVLAMMIIYFLLCSGFDYAFSFICENIAGIYMPPLAKSYLYILFIQIIISSFDIPFTVRLGDKKGSSVKILMLIIIILLLVALFIIFPVGMSDTLSELSKGSRINHTAFILLFVSAVFYMLSYYISCKLYMKGATSNYR